MTTHTTHKGLIIFLLAVSLVLGCRTYLAAEDAADNLDSLFEGGELIQQPEVPSQDLEAGSLPKTEKVAAAQDQLLVTEKLTWGGGFTSSFASNWKWTAGYPFRPDYTNPEDILLDINLGATLLFDARPDKDFRVLGKFKVNYPFSNSITTGSSSAPVSVNSIKVFELFSDFNWKNRLFFRAGKHTIKWGVGYFFSPADVLNLSPIEPQDPEAEREGPISIKSQGPLGLSNIYLYLVMKDITRPEEIAVAPKVEVLLWNLEPGLGFFYQKDLPPTGVLTISGPLWDFDIFGEAVVSYGSYKTYVRETTDLVNWPLGVETYEWDKKPYFSGTIGLRYTNADWHLLLAGQYYFNGLGYKDKDSEILKNSNVTLLVSQGSLSLKDLAWSGRHYAAVSAS
ncbi:MAG: hypothetical protein AB1798_17955, partial [Spirochaetota bacterium]